MYNRFQAEFTEQWKELSQTAATEMSINDIFRYYTHVIRARNGMGASDKEIALRKFYSEKNYERLSDDKVMPEIMRLVNFWYYLNTGDEIEPDEIYAISLESRKFIDYLFGYPNEYWKYVVSVYFMKNRDTADFEDNFTLVLKKITAYMFAKFLILPTVNAVKPDVYNACVAIEEGVDIMDSLEKLLEPV